jgi:GT2 family glycosyltransferase
MAHPTLLASVILVNYNGKRFLADCLQALEHQSLPRHTFEVILVDNGSKDDSIPFLTQNFPWVRILPTGANLGFTGGNRFGVERARGEWIVLLNNDTVVDPRWLQELLTSNTTKPFLQTGKLVFNSNPSQLNSTGLRLLRDGHGEDRAFRELDQGRFELTSLSFGACGASLAIRRQDWDEFDGLAADYFMYYEDLDLAWRGQLKGKTTHYSPWSVVRHIHCGSSGEWSPFFTYYVERNRVLTTWRNGDIYLSIRIGFSLLTRSGKAVVKSLMKPKDLRSRQIMLAYLKALGWLAIRMPVTIYDRWQNRIGSQMQRGLRCES